MFIYHYVTTQTQIRFTRALPESDRLCGLVVRVSGYTTEMYCVSCEVRTEFMYVMSSKILKMRMFATLDKVKPDTENIRGLNLAAVMCMTVQMSRLSL
jgi:hypothetical protein